MSNSDTTRSVSDFLIFSIFNIDCIKIIFKNEPNTPKTSTDMECSRLYTIQKCYGEVNNVSSRKLQSGVFFSFTLT